MLLALHDKERLCSYTFCAAALGEFYRESNQDAEAQAWFARACAAARNPGEARFLKQKLAQGAAAPSSDREPVAKL